MELYPENVVVFTINNLKGFVKPLVENPSDEYTRLGLLHFASHTKTDVKH